MRRSFVVSILVVAAVALIAASLDLPVKVPNFPERKGFIRNKITIEQLFNIVKGTNRGLIIDLKDETLQGIIYSGPYPFEAGTAPGASDYDHFRFRKGSWLEKGTGLIRISDFFRDKYNANNWPEGQGWRSTPTIGYRLDLWRVLEGGKVDHLGFYNGVASFKIENGVFKKVTTIIEGPFVTRVMSDDPSRVFVVWRTDEECVGEVHVEAVGTFKENSSKKVHEIEIRGLSPSSSYKYYVKCGETVSPIYTFYTAPRAGELDSDGVIRIAYAGDSREGVGGGEREYMGVNYKVMSWIAQDAYRRGADLLIFGGDLVNGYTSDPEDFRLQFLAWKQAVSGFWRSHPVYPGMGNHETLLRCFDDGSHYGVCLDRWPYDKESAEAVFAQEFYNPENGPEPSDPRRPTYKENVFSLKYGPVLIIAFNNNYWSTFRDKVPKYGGSPEGYIMEDQLKWIIDQLKKAKEDPTVKYIILYAQEPVFPCGGHVKDAMWYYGNNSVRAYTYKDGKLVPEKLGIIDVRNKLWEAVANNPKVAVVLGADEHEYYRVLITKDTPVNPLEDVNGDGKFTKGDKFAPNPNFKYPTWFITVGTAGAPFYSREWTPWKPVVMSSMQGYLLIEATMNKISAKFISITGQIVDEVDDLMAVKNK